MKLFLALILSFIFIKGARSADRIVHIKLKRNTGFVKTIGGHGSGGFLTKRLVLTNAHVCVSIPEYVTDYRGKQHEVKTFVIAERREVDLCLIQLKTGPSVLKLSIAKRGTQSVGERVYYAGYPFEFYTVKSGTIVERVMRRSRNVKNLIYLMDVPAQPGLSGSPVLNGQGKLIGVVYAAVVNSETNQHYTGIMPLELVRPFLKSAKKQLGL